ncbi:hypothetical protein F5X68DRAFT_268976 [Plectosphaerella plurivora]|uniref:Phosphoribosylaminoimidazole-succinocarboxamide synthase n=1 Tax=Plectosphaerella plurivora TaxID=936078 RepID=A0A9P8VCB6_9PEZI|nr:hypothetical protein F5X68DRAFT_268976 [Plectosphaerella plurivora]
MNYQDLTFDFVDRNRPVPPQFWSPRTPSEQSEATARPNDTRPHPDDLILDADQADQTGSLSPQPTVVPFAPTPPWEHSSTPSHSDQYGDTRVFGHPLIDNRPYARQSPTIAAPQLPVIAFDPRKLEASKMAVDEMTHRAQARGFRDEQAIDASGSITPGMDDGPFLNYALDALSAETWPSSPSSPTTIPVRSGLTAHGVPYDLPEDYYDFDDDDERYQPRHITAGHELESLQPITSLERARTSDSVRRSTERHSVLKPTPWGNLAAFNTTPPLTPVDPAKRAHVLNTQAGDENKVYPLSDTTPYTRDGKTRMDDLDPTRQHYPRINYLPRLLRLPAMMILMIACLFMITAFMLAAIFSLRRPGLVAFGDDIENAQYFLFRILPQMMGAIIFVYAQCIMTTTNRVLPFASMASEEVRAREDALFRDLYPRSFLVPHLAGPPAIKACQFIFWLSALIIPFSSSTFTVIRVDGSWTWTSVQPLTWVVVVFYFLLIGASLTLAMFWHRRHTGLLWDPRSMADIAHMLYQSNTLDDYWGTEMLEDPKQMRSRLHRRNFDRLGYWRTGARDKEPWYGIGLAAEYVDQPSREVETRSGEEMGLRESLNSLKMSIFSEAGEDAKYKYLPWNLRNTAIASFVAGGTLMLVALIALSFMRAASWMDGFNPGSLTVYPATAGFSPANFVYSFIPSFIGLLLLLSFQSLDLTLRALEPWAELNRLEGSPAQRSILLDYASCVPFQSTLRAIKNRHWRVAAVSLMASLAIAIPVLAGGVFMARNHPGTSDSRIYPSAPIFYLLLALLILYVLTLMSLVLKRSRYRLPHAVSSIAEIISFLNTEDVKKEKAFQLPTARTREQMLIHLGVFRRWDDNRWYFGPAPGREERLGVRRVKRFTGRKA